MWMRSVGEFILKNVDVHIENILCARRGEYISAAESEG